MVRGEPATAAVSWFRKSTALFYVYGFEPELNVFVNDWSAIVAWLLSPAASQASATRSQSPLGASRCLLSQTANSQKDWGDLRRDWLRRIPMCLQWSASDVGLPLPLCPNLPSKRQCQKTWLSFYHLCKAQLPKLQRRKTKGHTRVKFHFCSSLLGLSPSTSHILAEGRSRLL